ncbi:hypothetical protein D9757_002940 [Collybiopsis confluens]|uniref:Uncharacterized protein n=1 Tax=Collybiopsis confluens TaxID=2823264 RepID=A0A8H5HVG9_9AGAR|nr:hypothetical protein D9757_002940 [Collybiopsis confluens]
MATLIRNAKAGHEWTEYELEAYNIRIDYQDTATFFGNAILPPPTVHPDALNAEEAEDAHDKETARLLHHLRSAMIPEEHESAVADFATHLLEYMGFADPPRMTRRDKELSFLNCGIRSSASPDVCVYLERDGIILLVQEDKRLKNNVDATGQLIAEAIAAFQYVNNKRMLHRRDLLKHAVFPGIVMIGTAPRFFKIPVTTELNHAVRSGAFPEDPTVVSGYIPPVVADGAGFAVGMLSRNNRRAIFQCYEAFKKFVVTI